VHETVEGETIVVNLDTGSYYDLNELGGSIFALLNQGMAVAELAHLIATTYDLDEAETGRTVAEFTTRLVEEQLITRTDGAGASGNAHPPGAGAGLPAGYAEPVLNKYTDMQELLLLDPVHEVDEAGWPSKA